MMTWSKSDSCAYQFSTHLFKNLLSTQILMWHQINSSLKFLIHAEILVKFKKLEVVNNGGEDRVTIHLLYNDVIRMKVI